MLWIINIVGFLDKINFYFPITGDGTTHTLVDFVSNIVLFRDISHEVITIVIAVIRFLRSQEKLMREVITFCT